MTVLTIDIEAADLALEVAQAAHAEALNDPAHADRYARFGALAGAQHFAWLQRQQDALAEGARITQEEADAQAALHEAQGAYDAFMSDQGAHCTDNGYTDSPDARTQLLDALTAAQDALREAQA